MSDDHRASITIDVVSDVVCPWCFVGKRKLEQALALVPELKVELNWRPFQLDPTIPQGASRGGSIWRRNSGLRKSPRSMIG